MCFIQDLAGNNNNSIAKCVVYLAKGKSDQPEDGSYLEPKHVVERSNVRTSY